MPRIPLLPRGRLRLKRRIPRRDPLPVDRLHRTPVLGPHPLHYDSRPAHPLHLITIPSPPLPALRVLRGFQNTLSRMSSLVSLRVLREPSAISAVKGFTRY